MELRPYQLAAVDRVLDAWCDGRPRACVGLPTGSGKTEVAIEVIRRGASDGLTRLAFVVERLSLVDQARERIEAAGIRTATVQGDRTSTAAELAEAQVLVCSAQTLLSRDLLPDDLGVLAAIVDEAHYERQAVRRWLDAGIPMMGLTATPLAAWMCDAWDELISPVTTSELIEQGYLAAPLMRADIPDPTEAPDPLTGVRIARQAEDWSAAEAEAIMSPHTLAIAERWMALCAAPESDGGFDGRRPPTIVQASTKDHAGALADAFRRVDEPGAQWLVVTEDLDAEETRRAIRMLRDGSARGLVSVHKLAVGVDVPDVSILVMARPTSRIIAMAQWVGRLMRLPESERGEKRPVVLDCAGNAHRHARHLHRFWSRGAEWPLGSAREAPAGSPGPPQAGEKVCPDHPTVVQSPSAQVCQVCSRPLRDIARTEDASTFRADAVSPAAVARTILIEAQRKLKYQDAAASTRWARQQVRLLTGREPRPTWPSAAWSTTAHGAPDPVVRRTLRKNVRRYRTWIETPEWERPPQPPEPDRVHLRAGGD